MANSLRKALEGYDKLKSEGRIARIFDLKQELTITPLSVNKKKASKLVFGAGLDNAELITRQYLLLLFGGVEINRQLLSCYAEPDKPAVFALPKEWRDIIGKYGITIDRQNSSKAWNRYLLRNLYRYTTLIIKEMIYAGLQILNIRPISKPVSVGTYAFFCFLNEHNIPGTGNEDDSHDIISWYTNWSGRNKLIETICHNVAGAADTKCNSTNVRYINGPVLPLYRKAALFRYIGWCISVLLVSFVSFILGRWWNLLLLQESVSASKMRLQDPELIGKEYLFHNSGWMYKPLWTYETENQGAETYFYFYSTNCEGFKRINNKTQYYYGFDSMNWPTYLVWDTYQANFVRKVAGMDANIRVVGPIWFSSSNSALPSLPGNAIAVFDVQPMKDSFYKTLANDFDFYTKECCHQFLTDIYAACEKSGHSMILKRKREGGKYVHREYRKLIRELDTLPYYLSVDPDLSAYKLIENVKAVISMPYTSTALIAKEYNKPSVYYDPFHLLQKDDPAAHGIEIIQGKQELVKWISSLQLN